MTTKALVRGVRVRAPRQPDTVPVAVRLTPEEVAKADRYGDAEFRSRAAFVRLMYLRGIAAYERDSGIANSSEHSHAPAQVSAERVAG